MNDISGYPAASLSNVPHKEPYSSCNTSLLQKWPVTSSMLLEAPWQYPSLPLPSNLLVVMAAVPLLHNQQRATQNLMGFLFIQPPIPSPTPRMAQKSKQDRTGEVAAITQVGKSFNPLPPLLHQINGTDKSAVALLCLFVCHMKFWILIKVILCFVYSGLVQISSCIALPECTKCLMCITMMPLQKSCNFTSSILPILYLGKAEGAWLA